jgi:hypothetical protein
MAGDDAKGRPDILIKMSLELGPHPLPYPIQRIRRFKKEVLMVVMTRPVPIQMFAVRVLVAMMNLPFHGNHIIRKESDLAGSDFLHHVVQFPSGVDDPPGSPLLGFPNLAHQFPGDGRNRLGIVDGAVEIRRDDSNHG